jgi:hypothetical protein
MYHCTTVEILEIIIKRAPSLVQKKKKNLDPAATSHFQVDK